MSKTETATPTVNTEAIVTRDQLLGARKRRFTQFPVEGLNGKVRIRSLSEREKSDYESEFMDKKGNFSRDKLLSARRRLICLVVVDAEGNPLLTDDDVKALEEIDGRITSKIQEEAQVHCGIGRAQVEEEIKN
ncbi:MAG: hypothetical protein E6Q97_34120 [Desulfurellales bacterium]|nr:MAG: hypothetical protein E6Q97_34120 [Desulfurellales bacterium]